MEWGLPLLCTVGLVLVGASVLLGKDWMKKRMPVREWAIVVITYGVGLFLVLLLLAVALLLLFMLWPKFR